MPLSPEQRSQRASIAAMARWAKEDATDTGRRGQAGLMLKFAAEVDATAAAQGETLSETQRLRRIETMRRLYMSRLAFRSSRARAARKNADAAGDAA